MTNATGNNGGAADIERASTDRLMQDLRTVVEDAEALLRATAGEAGDKVQAARARAEQSLRAARERMLLTEEELALRARELGQDADRYVRENPWQAIGVAAGVALLVGLLLGRR